MRKENTENKTKYLNIGFINQLIFIFALQNYKKRCGSSTFFANFAQIIIYEDENKQNYCPYRHFPIELVGIKF